MTEPKKVLKRTIDLFETEAADDDTKDEAIEGEEILRKGDSASTNSKNADAKAVERMSRDDEINAFRQLSLNSLKHCLLSQEFPLLQ